MYQPLPVQQPKFSMDKNYINFPDCWEEVMPLEWIHLLKIREKLITQSGLNLLDVKREWCAYVLKNRGFVFKRRIQEMLLVNDLANSLTWMWQSEGKDVMLTYDSTINLMPQWRYLRGPMSHGGDMTFGEFRHAAAAINKYNTEHDILDLHALCAILYRPYTKKKGVIKREIFRDQNINRYIGLVQKMPEYLMWGIYAWFAYFCEYLFTGSFIIDGLEVSFSSLFSRTKEDGNDTSVNKQNLGMNSILYSVAECGVFGNTRATDDTLLLRVMMKLLDDKQRADELMKNFKK